MDIGTIILLMMLPEIMSSLGPIFGRRATDQPSSATAVGGTGPVTPMLRPLGRASDPYGVGPVGQLATVRWR